jgi:large subunit ribosomal protein L10
LKGSTKAGMLKLMEKIRRPSEKGERVRASLLQKERVVEEIKELLKSHKAVAIIDLQGVPANQYKKIKSELSRYGIIKVFKNNVFLRAFKELGLEGVEELSKYLTGINAFMFTNENPYEIALRLEKTVAPRFAKPGDKAEDDIYVPEGPTGIPPGPMLSVFGKLKIRTQVREGVIWIAKETKVASAGDEISPELSSLLRRLGIKPVMVRLRLKAVWEDGKVYPVEELKVDVDAFKADLLKAVAAGKEVAVEAALPLPDVLPEILARAYRRAELLAAEAGFVTPETASAVFKAAVAKALALAIKVKEKAPDIGIDVEVPAAPAPAAAAPSEEKKEEEEEEKEVSEEEIAEGISSLFG